MSRGVPVFSAEGRRRANLGLHWRMEPDPPDPPEPDEYEEWLEEIAPEEDRAPAA